jgi:long-chain fatty acid transport protein
MLPEAVSQRRLLIAFLLGATAAQVFGLGSRIPNQDATAIGRGNAFAATADNPSALYYNPAGITQLQGQYFQAGSLFYLSVESEYESPTTGVTTHNQEDLIAVPELYYTFTPQGMPVSFGLGIYSPFGLGMNWPDNVPFRSSGLEAEIKYITVNPVVAWHPIQSLSVAAGPTFNYSEATLRQGVVASPYQFHFKGDDWGYGFNAGILWQPHPQWSFGAKYMSQTTLDYKGTASFRPSAPFLPGNSETTAHLDYPQILAGGVSYRPTTNWNIEVDVDWTDWDAAKTAKIDGVSTLPLYWHSSYFYEVGVTRQLGGGYFVSAGYFFSETSTSDHYYTSLVPDTDLHVGSLGIGRRGQHWDWAVSGQIIGGEHHEVSNAANPTVNGKWQLFTPTVSFTIGLHF